MHGKGINEITVADVNREPYWNGIKHARCLGIYPIAKQSLFRCLGMGLE